MKKQLNTETIKNELEGSVFFPRALQAPATPLPQHTATEHTTPEPASRQADLHANLQTCKDANQQASKPASLQAGKDANVQTGKQVNLQTGKQVMIEKYSSYLTHEYKRELKRIAFETDRNEYEVLMEAVGHYLSRQKQRT